MSTTSVTTPVTFQAIVDEIVRFRAFSEAEVKHRVWLEAIRFGWNVACDVKYYAVTPHAYDKQVNAYTAAHGIGTDQTRILMVGDGAGNDSLLFAEHGYSVDHFEVPGSATYKFATERFAHAGRLKRGISLIGDLDKTLSGEYDIVISFEVLEHLPDPVTAIRAIPAMLKAGGFALVTEGFGALDPSFQTHLGSNGRFAGRTPYLFFRNDMILTGYSRRPLFKPVEFTKVRTTSWPDRLRLLADRTVIAGYVGARASAFERRVRRWVWGSEKPGDADSYGSGFWSQRQALERSRAKAPHSTGQRSQG